MKTKIALVTVLADDVPAMVQFYRDALGFALKGQDDGYVELESEGVRFAVCSRAIMADATGHSSYKEPRRGQAFELAFPVEAPEEVDRAYAELLARGAAPVMPPTNMPWGQRTACFADPEGNIHELFADLPKV